MMCLLGLAYLSERKYLRSIKPKIIYDDKYSSPYILYFPYATRYYYMPKISGKSICEVWDKFNEFKKNLK